VASRGARSCRSSTQENTRAVARSTSLACPVPLPSDSIPMWIVDDRIGLEQVLHSDGLPRARSEVGLKTQANGQLYALASLIHASIAPNHSWPDTELAA
jgi:hypothetical protein